MSARSYRFVLPLAVLFMTCGLGGAQEKAAPLVTPSTVDRATMVDDVIRQLALRFDVERPIDASLKDVVDDIHGRLGVNFQIDAVAFKNTEPPLENVEETRIKITRTKNIRLDQFLEQILKPIGGICMVRPGHVEITTMKDAMREAAGGLAWYSPPFASDDDEQVVVSAGPLPRGPIVNVLLGDRTFAAVMRDLTDQFGDRNILIAPQVGTKVKTVLSGRLLNVPLNDALGIVAEMADLKCVSMNNTYLITTRDRAEPMLRELAERQDVRQIQSLLANNGIFTTPTQIRLKYFQPLQSAEPKRPSRPSWNDYSQKVRERQNP